MGISFVGATTANGVTGTTISTPAGIAVGNILLLYATSSQSRQSLPSGWTSIYSDSHTFCASHIVASGDPTNVTFMSSTDSFGALAAMVAYAGQATTSPINVSAGTGSATGTTVATPSITPTVNGCQIIGWVTAGNPSSTPPTLTAESGTTQRAASTVTRSGGFGNSYAQVVEDESQATAAAISLNATTNISQGGAAAVIVALAPGAQTYDETAGSVAIHATGSGVDHAVDDELSGQQAIHATTGGTDGWLYVETSGSVPIIAALSGTDAIVVLPPPPMPPLTIQLTNNGRTSLALTVTQPTAALVAASRITADIDPAAPTTVAVEPSRTAATLTS